jgi:hypothetical protein
MSTCDRYDLGAVEDEEGLHGGVPHALGGVEHSKVAEARRARRQPGDAAVQFDDLPQGEIPPQAMAPI